MNDSTTGNEHTAGAAATTATDTDAAPETTTDDTDTVTVLSQVLAPFAATALARMLDTGETFEAGTELPPLWHWTYLLDPAAEAELAPDGHPTTGLPTPPEPGMRRMFAGGRVDTLRPLVLGEEATRTTRVTDERVKEGRSGTLRFVTVRHEIAQRGGVAIVEEQDVVYRRADGTTLPDPAPEPIPEDREARLALDVDERMLFRFSALTFNTHRIHYDRGWCAVEGYDGLVVHGPLQALMMGELRRRRGASLVGTRVAYRNVAPMVGIQTLAVLAGEDGLDAGAEVRGANGNVTATARFEALR